MNQPGYLNLLSAAVDAAIAAGKAIMDVYSSTYDITLKSDASPLTTADLRAHETIKKMLAATEIPLLSEEGREIPWEERSAWDLFWLVDPLDGTKEFISRNGEFTVNIALIKGEYPVAGVIFFPVTGTLYFAAEGLGSYRLYDAVNALEGFDLTSESLVGAAQRLPAGSEDKRLFTIVASRSHMNDETRDYIDQVREKQGDILLISSGSSMKICLVAEGKADIYPRFGPTSEWDTAAGQAIVELADGSMVDALSQERIHYNKKNLLNPYFIVFAKK